MSTVTFEDTDFETEFPVDEYHEPEIKRLPDGKVKIGYLSHDTDPGMEFEWGDYEFKEFRSEESRDEFYDNIQQPDVGFIVEHYEHSGHHFSLVDSGNYPDRQWDVRPSCVLVVPGDVEDKREAAKAMLDEYNAYCGGEVYGVCVETFNEDGTPDFSEATWGYIGDDYAMEQMRGEVAA